MRRSIAAAAGALLVAASVIACSSDGGADATPSATIVGGQAVCDEDMILTAVEVDFAANYPGSTFVAMDDFTCEDGWVTANVEFEASGSTFPTVVYLRAEGQFWVPTTIEEICATPSPGWTVPQEIAAAACGEQ